jgi:cellulose synthase/poly-beta-1,6-N-acetylglucosamine synthase-like glycosyltransferase
MTAMFDWLLVILGLPSLAIGLYLLALTLLWRRPTDVRGRHENLRYCVLVPAHNEACGIGNTVRSLDAIDYPAHLRRTVVVADNCTDDTAGVAAAAGALVIQRCDTESRGKGFALRYAIDELLRPAARHPEWDVLVVVDADTVVTPNLLQVLSAHFERGASAVQAAYLPRQAGNSAIAVITNVAFVAIHLVRSVARERLGLSCGLRGNGMAFRRELLAAVPHTAFSRTEDLEFGVMLGLQGVRVAFAAETRVFGDMPEHSAAVTSQRERWIGGRSGIARRFVGPLLRAAVRQRSLMLADLAIDLMVPALSVATVVAAAGLLGSVAIAVATEAHLLSTLVWWVAFAALVIHVWHAAGIADQTQELVMAAGAIPGYALDKTLIALRMLRRSDETWIRTPRKGEAQ